MLIKGCKWVRETFELGSRPTEATLIRWIETEQVPGKIIDGKPYVDADRFALGGPTAKPPNRVTGVDLMQ